MTDPETLQLLAERDAAIRRAHDAELALKIEKARLDKLEAAFARAPIGAALYVFKRADWSNLRKAVDLFLP